MSRARFSAEAIFHKRSGLIGGGFSHAQRKAQFPSKNFIVFLYKLPNDFSCISTKIGLYCNCSKKVLKNSTNAAKCSLNDKLSLFFLSFLLFSSLWSDHTSRSRQSRLGFYPSLFCFCLKFYFSLSRAEHNHYKSVHIVIRRGEGTPPYEVGKDGAVVVDWCHSEGNGGMGSSRPTTYRVIMVQQSNHLVKYIV